VQHRCPTCQRAFDEPGFCPFDRSALVVDPRASGATPDQATILSAQMPAEVPRSHPADDTQALTRPRTQLGPGPSKTDPDPPRLRAMSASQDPAAALDAVRSRDNYYDRLVGQTLDGRYFVDRKIGEGGMGVVFAARHAVIERPLAIKVLKREVMRDTATIKRFVQEAQAASRIGHPNIVDVTDFGTTPEGLTYSVMEFVAGKTLGAALREASPFPARRAIKIALQIARALGAAHDKGIVHRDLKPENVFLLDREQRTDFVKIVDFGIAKVVPVAGHDPGQPRLTRAGSVFGTPEYMAPEQAAGRETDHRADIYALGILLYEMITGRVPHRGDSAVRTLAMQMLDPVVPPSQVRPELAITPGLEAVILKALVKPREARYQTMAELQAALEVLDNQLPMVATPGPLALAPLPPGADLAAVEPPSIPFGPIPVPTPVPVRPLRDEPQFVHDKPPTFEHVFTEVTPAPTTRRWPMVIFGGLIVAGAAAAIAVVATSRQRVADRRGELPTVLADAAEPYAPADAVVIAEIPVDAPDILIEPDLPAPRDAGIRVRPPRPDAGVAVVAPSRRGVAIQVITKPEGANLYVGHTYRGPGGTQLEESFGTRLDVQCRLRGYKPGTVSLVFDGKVEYVLCVLERIKICIDGIKNPFDDCEPAP
jgi:serine/threonine protein kinase